MIKRENLAKFNVIVRTETSGSSHDASYGILLLHQSLVIVLFIVIVLISLLRLITD